MVLYKKENVFLVQQTQLCHVVNCESLSFVRKYSLMFFHITQFLAKLATIMILDVKHKNLYSVKTWNVWLTVATANVTSDFIF